MYFVIKHVITCNFVCQFRVLTCLYANPLLVWYVWCGCVSYVYEVGVGCLLYVVCVCELYMVVCV